MKKTTAKKMLSLGLATTALFLTVPNKPRLLGYHAGVHTHESIKTLEAYAPDLYVQDKQHKLFAFGFNTGITVQGKQHIFVDYKTHGIIDGKLVARKKSEYICAGYPRDDGSIRDLNTGREFETFTNKEGKLELALKGETEPWSRITYLRNKSQRTEKDVGKYVLQARHK